MRRGLLALLLLAGCSYDWTVPEGTSPSDAGRDVLPGDASVADAVDAPPIDAPVSADADAGPTDTGTETGADCNQLKQNVDSAFDQAVKCQTCTASSCMASTTDQCGCTVYVCDGMATATGDYIAAVNAFKSAGCLAQFAPCGDACPLATKGLCSLTDAAGMFGCYY